MTFHRYDPHSLDTPPAMEGLRGLHAFAAPVHGLDELGIAPIYLITGGLAAGATLTAWLAKESWSVGEYNDWMLAMDQTIHEWDKLGWKTGCWQNNPAKRRQWLDFWKRFSTHYREHGRIATFSFVSDSEEKPARNLMEQLRAWGSWLNKTCGTDIELGKEAEEPTSTTEHPWEGLIKWGAIGLGALVVLNVVQGVRGGFGPRYY